MGATTTKPHSRKHFVDSLSLWLLEKNGILLPHQYRTEKLPKQQQKQSNKQQQKPGVYSLCSGGFYKGNFTHVYNIPCVSLSYSSTLPFPSKSPLFPYTLSLLLPCPVYRYDFMYHYIKSRTHKWEIFVFLSLIWFVQ